MTKLQVSTRGWNDLVEINSQMEVRLYIGTSGFYYRHWLGCFYPKGIKQDQLLGFYSQRFNTVEINSTFYRLPSEKTVLNWKKKVSPGFVFSFKGSRIITHLKKFSLDRPILKSFFSRLDPFAEKPPSHLILFQTPSFFRLNKEKLTKFLADLPSTFLYGFEFRHQSWFVPGVYSILKKHQAALVLSDSPQKKNGSRLWPRADVDTAGFFYIRLHGSRKLYRSSYSEKELKDYAKLIKEKLKKGMVVFCYFNNDAQGYGVDNANKLKHLIEKRN